MGLERDQAVDIEGVLEGSTGCCRDEGTVLNCGRVVLAIKGAFHAYLVSSSGEHTSMQCNGLCLEERVGQGCSSACLVLQHAVPLALWC